MAKLVDLPQEIIDNVIAAAGDDTHLLKQCSLVSSSFHLPSSKQLFSTVTIGNDKTQGIHQLLIQNPDIRTYVRAITVIWDEECLDDRTSESLLAILRLPFCCLESFSIVYEDHDGDMVFYLNPEDYNLHGEPWDWDCFSSEMKDALSNIILSSTLKTLYLYEITNVPTTLFLQIDHLTTLKLHSLTPNDFVDENSLTRAASKGVAPAPIASSSHTVIDRCVWRYGEEHVFQSRPLKVIFLPFMCRLRFLEIYLDLSYGTTEDFKMLSSLFGSLSISLTSPEHLKFDIRFRNYSNNISITTFYENLRNAWCDLDSIASHPTSSRLQRVDININYVSRCNGVKLEKDGFLKAVLDGLPLLRMKGILFVGGSFKLEE